MQNAVVISRWCSPRTQHENGARALVPAVHSPAVGRACFLYAVGLQVWCGTVSGGGIPW